MAWPERGEIVSGGTIASGGDPAAAPQLSDIRIEGGDDSEGKLFDMPDPAPAELGKAASCATS
jgi:hypothetical protein